MGVPCELSRARLGGGYGATGQRLLQRAATNLGAGGRAKAVGRGLSADGRPRICDEGGDGGDRGEGGRVVRVGDREPGQGLGDLRPESAPAQPDVEDAADRQPGAAGQGRGADSARLRESRPVAEGPDTGGGEAVQGTRGEDHGAGDRGRGSLPAVAQGSEAGGGFHPEPPAVGTLQGQARIWSFRLTPKT